MEVSLLSKCLLYFDNLTDILMIFAPNIGFIAQIIKFRQCKSSEGFSKFISLILLLANIIRIFFWLGDPFDNILVYQSIVSIGMQIILLRECLKYSSFSSESIKKGNNNSQENYQNPYLYKPINIFDIKSFWNWPYLIDYLYTLCLFSIILGFICNFVGFDKKLFFEGVGIVGVSVEAMIGIPQVINNYKTKSTETLSFFMILTWAIGDSLKTVYFVHKSSPMQFLACGIFQFTIDVIILLQIFWYRNKNTPTIGKSKIKMSNKEENEFISLSSVDYPDTADELQDITIV